MGTDPWGFDEERQALARKLRRKRRWFSWTHTGVLLLFLGVLLAGASGRLRSWVTSSAWPGWAAASVFLVLLYTIGTRWDGPTPT